MTKTLFLDHLSEILEVPQGSLSSEENLLDIEGWTSMAMVSFVGFADEHFRKSISPRQIAACDTVGDLGRLVGIDT